MEEEGGNNLYGFVLNRAIDRIDKLGTNVYIAYRPLDVDFLRTLFPVAGHVYLAFDDENMGDPSIWTKTLTELNYSRRDWHTFSFHPDSVRTKTSAGNKVSVVYTDTSWVDRNNEKSDVIPIRKGDAFKILVTKDPCEQAAIFRQAHKSYLANSGGYGGDGDYSFVINNCGSWAKSIIEEANAKWPKSASFLLNAGTGLNGLADITLLPQTAYGLSVGGYYAVKEGNKIVQFVITHSEVGVISVRAAGQNEMQVPGIKINF